MNSEPDKLPDRELEDFIFRFLKHNGADLEVHDSSCEVLLPEELSQLLGADEYIHLTRSTGSGPGGGHLIAYGSPFLEKVLTAACGQVPILNYRLEFAYLKSQGFDRLIQEQLRFFGSVGRVESRAEVFADYILLTCRYTAQSDEQKEGLVALVFNLESGAFVPDMIPGLSSAAREYGPESPLSAEQKAQVRQIVTWLQNHAETALYPELNLFHESMTRRFRRDAAILEEYYAGLAAEMEKSLQRPGLSAQLIAERKEKIALIPDELDRKKDDLFKKYSIRVTLEPCAGVLIRTPAVKLLYRAAVGRKNKNISIIYNPVTKALDPPVCQGCGISTTHIYFCDSLHMLCPDCRQSCPAC